MADAMPDTAQAGSRSDGPSTFPPDWKTLAYSALAILLLSKLVPVLLGRVVGGALGWYLRRASSGRREHLLGFMRLDQDRYRERYGQEKLRGSDEGKTESGEDKPGADWEGVVGFFHPFW